MIKRCEPWRVLFPLGAMIGMFGVLLWPAFVYGWMPHYPGIMHARIMVQGFLFCFMAGFLGSALPQMLEVPGITFLKTIVLAFMFILMTTLHSVGQTAAADACFSLLVVVLFSLVFRHWRNRKDLPPPGFALAILGVLCGAFGSLLMAFNAWGFLPLNAYAFGQLLLYHGFILFPAMGAGVYLLPRMVGLPNQHLIKPASRTPSKMWRRRAYFMLSCGVLVIISFVMQVLGATQPALMLRAFVILVCVFHELPLHRARHIRGTIPKAVVIAFLSIITGYVLQCIWPSRAVSYMHIAFISGFGLLVMNIGARVMQGHSGNVEALFAKSVPVRWITGLIIFTAATRLSADLIPGMQWSHYAYAGILWAAVLLLWLVVFGPLVTAYPGKGNAQG